MKLQDFAIKHGSHSFNVFRKQELTNRYSGVVKHFQLNANGTLQLYTVTGDYHHPLLASDVPAGAIIMDSFSKKIGPNGDQEELYVKLYRTESKVLTVDDFNSTEDYEKLEYELDIVCERYCLADKLVEEKSNEPLIDELLK